MNVLALNCGSSSLKFGIYRVSASACELLFDDQIETGGGPASGAKLPDALAEVEQRIGKAGTPALDAVGHRIVHGGPKLRQHCLIDAATLRQLEAATPFAPLHTPRALAVVKAALRHFPGLPQLACFDTSFHSSLPDVARILPLPRELLALGVQRYGFHGLSCESIVHQLGSELPERLIVAHLGNGASVTAVKGGRSVDTSMGMTPAGGVPMGTRSGDIDPGVLIYLMREQAYQPDRIEQMINHHSGLLGVSGLSSDMRQLRQAADTDADARLAMTLFASSVAKQIAAMITVLDGVDTIVFTGGIGEHDVAMRVAIIQPLRWLGLHLDPALNPGRQTEIHQAASRCRILVLDSQEDAQIARHTGALLGYKPGSG